ncbi:hypothetical protein Pmani_005398 [Petrolisthes manimaculis]|uniref:Protein AAR2 homolog n=1 Tax=Petrolisthes manimaculis TaxID=1843537 RepID=A0AAE1QCB1_9EUCA|nr:hypothetical protein Pmani_005398 [Petrolisthes manimaculis]
MIHQYRTMDPDVARQMFEEGGTLVMLGMPIGTEFGIDLNFWNVGEKFRGVKMIPPGLHFVYFSAVNRQGDTAPRTGFFHVFESREVLVRHYDPVAEDLTPGEANPTEVESIRASLQNLDPHLGAYPLESWSKWVSLTQHISPSELRRMVPLSGKICSAPELITEGETDGIRKWSRSKRKEISIEADSEQLQSNSSISKPSSSTHIMDSDDTVASSVPSTTTSIESIAPTTSVNIFTSSTTSSSSASQQDADCINNTSQDSSTIPTPTPNNPGISSKMPNMVPRPGTEVRFTKFPSKPYQDGATPSEVTRHCLDSTYSVRCMLEGLESAKSLVAELQLAFVTFLVGQMWDGWEHWRALLSSLCRASQLIEEQPQLYNTLLSVLHFQINEVPEDLFVDIVESNNFLAAGMATLFTNLADAQANLPPALTRKAERFRAHLSTKFDWDLSLEDTGEDAPVVVEL